MNTALKIVALAIATISLTTQAFAQPCDGFRTQTQGGWGACPNGNNPASYLHANFNSAFTGGVTIGCNNTLHLATAQDVRDFLPSGSSPSGLPAGATINPGGNYNNVFAGQVTALTLTVGFDNYDPNFGSSSTLLQDLIINSGTFQGWTVGQVLQEANNKIGGCGSSYSYSQLNNIISNINQNYVDGNSNGGLLDCPPACQNVTDAGEIGYDTAHCGPFDPILIQSVLPSTGGVGPVEYMWLMSDTLVTNIAGNPYWQPIANTNSADYAPGLITETTYFIRCSRNENCPDWVGESNVVTVTVHEGVTVAANDCAVSCHGACDGHLIANATSGTAPFTYDWGAAGTGAQVHGVCAGTYTVTVTDANGCSATATVNVNSPAPLMVLASGTDISCFGACDGTADAAVSGGTAPYTYAWSNNASTSALSNLCEGTYDVVITDDNGCSTSEIVNVVEPTQISLSATTFNASCAGSCDGIISAEVQGGTMPYTTSWSNGATGTDLLNACAGTYTLTIVDDNGCTVFAQEEIYEPNALTVTSSSTPESCGGSADGTAMVTAMGGSGTFTYDWSNGGTTQGLTNLAPGTYDCTITDQNGCDITESVSVIGAPSMTHNVIIDHIDCPDDEDGYIEIVTLGGTPPYTTTWSTGATGDVLADVPAATYGYTVVDANGCNFSGVAEVTTTTPMSATVAGFVILGQCNGWATVTMSGGTPPYTYNWIQGGNTATINNLCAGNYPVIVTDANGCTFEECVVVGPYGAQSCLQGSGGGSGGGGSDDPPKEKKNGVLAGTSEFQGHITTTATPNPFQQTTRVSFATDYDTHALVEVFDLSGAKVASLYDGDVNAGLAYSFNLDGKDLVPGIYVYIITTNNQHISERILLMD